MNANSIVEVSLKRARRLSDLDDIERGTLNKRARTDAECPLKCISNIPYKLDVEEYQRMSRAGSIDTTSARSHSPAVGRSDHGCIGDRRSEMLGKDASVYTASGLEETCEPETLRELVEASEPLSRQAIDSRLLTGEHSFVSEEIDQWMAQYADDFRATVGGLDVADKDSGCIPDMTLGPIAISPPEDLGSPSKSEFGIWATKAHENCAHCEDEIEEIAGEMSTLEIGDVIDQNRNSQIGVSLKTPSKVTTEASRVWAWLEAEDKRGHQLEHRIEAPRSPSTSLSGDSTPPPQAQQRAQSVFTYAFRDQYVHIDHLSRISKGGRWRAASRVMVSR